MPLPGETITENIWPGIPTGNAPISTSSSGTATSGATETFDVVLGYYQFTAINGHRYLATMNGLIGNGSVAADVFTVQIRDSGNSSNPTSGSLLVAQQEWYCSAAGTAGRSPVPLGMTWVAAGSGVHTLGVSATRVAGTGVFTPTGLRELYVVDLGGN
jgi:hypothetical protein